MKTSSSFHSVRQKISEHLPYVLGIVLWIVTNIVSAIFSPWDNGPIIDQLLLGGAYDIWSLKEYASSAYEGNTIILFIVICAAFSYIQILKKIFDKIPDGFAINNLIAYISCILCYYILLPVSDKIIGFYNSMDTQIKIAIFVIFAVFILLPSLISMIRLWLYSIAASFLGTTVIQPTGANPIIIILSVIIVFVVMNFLDSIFDKIIANPTQEKINKITVKIIKQNPFTLILRKIITTFKKIIHLFK